MTKTTNPALTPEELAEIERRFENFDPAEGTAYDMTSDDVPPHIRLVQAMAARKYYELQATNVMRKAVDDARAKGLSWHKIGVALGTTGEAARQRYSRTN